MKQLRDNHWALFSLACLMLAWMVACSEQSDKGLVRATEPGFTGVVRCGSCHTNNLGEWRKSLHSRAMAVSGDSTVVGDFEDAVYVYGGVHSRMFRRDGDFFMETVGVDGKRETYRVDYTIGVRQHQAYLTQFPNGHYQVLPLYHDGPKDRWVDAQEGGVVEQGAPLSSKDYYYWTNRGRTWNFHCFDCHASRVEKHYDIETDTYRTTVGSLSIDCEACHGPSGKHDETRGQVGESLHLVELKGLPKEQAVEVCAQCHAAKEIVATGYLPGAPFYDYFQMVLPDDDPIFYPDGQPKVYLYPAVLHWMSSCYVNDELRCTTCHDAHGSDRAVDLVADREGVGLCEDCHPDVTEDTVAHSHHPLGSSGNQCVQCHMPYYHVTGENLTDHRIQSPVPKNTVVNGVPNACNQAGCHIDQSARWASSWAEKWYGAYQDEPVARTRAVKLGQGGNRNAVMDLVGMLEGDPNWVWRAVAATLLGKLGDGRAVEELMEGLGDGHPMVRNRSVVALGRLGDYRAIPGLLQALSDSVRSVRIVAPFALMDIGYTSSTPTFLKALDEHREVVEGVQGDDPGFHEGLGQVYELQGRYAESKREYQIVERLDPDHPETAVDLKRLQEKRTSFLMLEKMLKGGPEHGYNRARWGVLYLQHGHHQAALDVLEGVVDDVSSVVFDKALGDARLGVGDLEGALRAYGRVLSSSPGHRTAVRQVALAAFSGEGEAGGVGIPGDDLENEIQRGVREALAGRLFVARAFFSSVLQRESRVGNVSDTLALFGLSREAQQWVVDRANTVFESGMTAYQAGELESALPLLEQSIGLNPDRVEPYAMRGLILADLGKLNLAEGAVQDALLTDPGYVPAYTILGSIYQERGELELAMQTYQQGWVLDSEAVGLEFYMSQVYLMQGQRDSARAVLRRVVKREPGNGPARALLEQVEREQGL